VTNCATVIAFAVVHRLVGAVTRKMTSLSAVVALAAVGRRDAGVRTVALDVTMLTAVIAR